MTAIAKYSHILFVCLVAVITSNLTLADEIEPVFTEPTIVYRADGSFDSVKEALVFAIENEGLVITTTAHSSEMYDRTANAVGVKKRIFSNAESLFFCQAALSHALIQENPHAMLLCPYSIGIYALEAEPEVVYLSIRKPEPGLKTYAPIHELLKRIIVATIEF